MRTNLSGSAPRPNIAPIMPVPMGISPATVVAGVAALASLGALGYFVWKYRTSTASAERQAQGQSDAQDLLVREEEQAGTQKLAAEQEAAKKAAATGTGRLASVSFDILPYTTNLVSTSYLHMQRRAELPIGVPVTVRTAENDREFQLYLTLSPVNSELELSVKQRSTNFMGEWESYVKLPLRGLPSVFVAGLGTLVDLQAAVTKKASYDFFTDGPSPDVGITLTPVTWTYK